MEFWGEIASAGGYSIPLAAAKDSPKQVGAAARRLALAPISAASFFGGIADSTRFGNLFILLWMAFWLSFPGLDSVSSELESMS